MKHCVYLYVCLIFVFSTGRLYSTCTTSSGGPRVWDLILGSKQILNSINSSLDILNNAVNLSSIGTFTVLNTINNNTISALDSLQESLSLASTIDTSLTQLENFVNNSNQLLQSIIDITNTIHIADFPGTWTLIQAIQKTTISSFDIFTANLIYTSSQISVIAAQELDQFIATFTTIEAIAVEVLNTLTLIQALDATVDAQLDAINTVLISVENEALSIYSNSEVLNTDMQSGFIGTFSSLQVLLNMSNTINSDADFILNLVGLDIESTVTTLNFLLQQTYTVESKVNYLDAAASALENTVFTIDSKADFFTSKLINIESKLSSIDQVNQTNESLVNNATSSLNLILSKVEAINIDTGLSKTAVLNSKVDYINTSLVNALSSSLDILISENNTIKSEVDVINAQSNSVIENVLTISSKVTILNVDLITVDSKINFFASTLNSESSKLDVFGQQTVTSYIAVANSLMDQVNASINDINMLSSNVITQLATLGSTVSTLDSVIDHIAQGASTLCSKIDVGDILVRTSTGITNAIFSVADTLSSKISIANSSASTLSSILNVLSTDFQQTWTILQSTQNQSNSILGVLMGIDTQLGAISADLSTTYTALNALNSNELTLLSQLSVANSTAANLRCIAQTDINGTYTVLNAISRLSNSMTSVALTGLNTTQNITNYYGIPLYQTDIGTTGTLLTVQGRYYIAQNIVFNPASPGLAAITVANNNIEILMYRYTLSQSGSQPSVAGIRILSPYYFIKISDGTIQGFTGNGIEVQSRTKHIFINDMNIQNMGGDGISFLTTCSVIEIRDCMIGGSAGDGLNISSASSVFIHNTMFTDNGSATTNNGLTVTNSDCVLVDNCMSTTNSGNGYSLTATTTTLNVTIQYCKAFQNNLSGIVLGETFGGEIIGCISSENVQNGIHLLDCQNISVINNFCMSNGTDGIVLDTNRVGTNNCYVGQNSLLLTGSVNLREASGSGANSIFSNFALSANGANNYVALSKRTYLNFLTVSQTGAANIGSMVKWYNISMTT